MKNKKYIQIAHNNLRDTIKNRMKNISTAEIYETEDFLFFTIGMNTEDGHLNGCLAFNDEAYKETYAAAKTFSQKWGFPFSFWIRDGMDLKLESLLKEKGYKASRTPGSAIMYTEDRIKSVPISDEFKIKEVKTRKDAKDVAIVIQEAFRKEKEVIDKMFSSMDNLDSNQFKSFVIYDKDKNPVSTAITSLTNDSAGVYYVSTIEEARSKGLGKAITTAATNIAFDCGEKIVILQASSLGEIVYRKLGFHQTGIYRTYKIK